MGVRWSLARWRLYNLCPRWYKYRYIDSIRKYSADANFLEGALYQRKHFHEPEFIYYEALRKAIPRFISEAVFNFRVRKVFQQSLIHDLMAYPESDRADLEKRFTIKFEGFIEELRQVESIESFSQGCEQGLETQAEFDQFEIDDVKIDLYLDLVWRGDKKLNFLMMRREKFVTPSELALQVLYAVKQFGVDPGRVAVWQLICEPKIHLSRLEIQMDELYELRERINESSGLLNSCENDFPYTKDMASCELCDFRSICERFIEPGTKVKIDSIN